MTALAFEECTETVMTEIRLYHLAQIAEKLKVKITDVIVSNGRVKYSTPDGAKVVEEYIGEVEHDLWLGQF